MKSYLYLVFVFSAFISNAQTQPAQPATGPGGSNYTHGGVTIFDYATGGNGEDFWLYEPNNPTPDSANVIVFCHGLGMVNPKAYGAFIKHLVRKGNIVIYPRYQRDLNLGTGITVYNDSCAKGIRKALDTIQQPGHVKGRIENYFILGHSVGGVLTANMTMLHVQYGLPKPLTAFSMQPGAATYLMNDYSGFPYDVKFLIAVGQDDAIVGTAPGYTIYNQATDVSTSHKNLVHQYADTHGNPDVTASHNEPCGFDNQFDNGETNLFIPFVTGNVDAVDFYCYWKLQDALMDCALYNQNCDVAFGNTAQQKSMGSWSDGTPVRVLEIVPGDASAVDEKTDGVSVQVYPNPSAGGAFAVTVKEELVGSDFVLMDGTGRTVAKQTVTATNFVVQGKNSEAGVYFYQLTKNGTGVKQTGKLIID